MKKLSILFSGFIVCIWMFLSGCSSSTHSTSDLKEWMSPNGKIKVLSTTGMIDNIVGQIGADRVDHIALIVGEIDPHGYELVKGDDEKLCFSQIVFYNGLGLEHGASLRYSLSHHRFAIALGDSIQTQFPEAILHVGDDIDPHIWMDISLWSDIVDPIAEALASIDPSGKEVYEKNAQALKSKMLLEHAAIQKAFAAVPSQKRYLVTSHDAFNYFTRAYLRDPGETQFSQWKARFDAPEGLAPEGQLSTSDIQQIVDHLIRYNIRVVFPESNVSVDSLKKIVHACHQKGLDVKISSGVLYGDAMGGKGSGAEDYLGMMHHNADVMIQEWQKEK